MIIMVSLIIPVMVWISGCQTATEKEPVIEDTQYASISHYVAIGDPQKAMEEYEKAYRQDENNPKTRLLHARLLLYAGMAGDALEELKQLRDIDPENTDILFSLAMAYGLEGKRKQQKEILSILIEKDGNNTQALSFMGEMYLEDKNLDKAQEYFDKTLDQDSGHFVALMGKGNVLIRKKEYKKAEAVFDKAVEEDPRYPFAYVDRATTKRALKDREGAIADLSEAIKIEPDYYFSYVDRGRIYLDMRKKDLAMTDFKKAMEINPDYFLAYVYAAGIHQEREEYEEAAVYYKKVMELKPEYYYAYSPLGTYYYMKENWEESSAMFKKAFAYEKSEYNYGLLAALALKKAGQEKEATEYLDGLLKLLPAESWYWHMARFYINSFNDYYVIKAADEEKNKLIRAQILFYLANQYMLSNKYMNAAMTYLTEIVSLERKDITEWILADWELKHLGENN
ncbi:MAG: tetratricopeptide repeat protein [Spirochaetales bacterium]|nr:tetratricopeptide repeat protein [Spirochaetales bacterium]